MRLGRRFIVFSTLLSACTETTTPVPAPAEKPAVPAARPAAELEEPAAMVSEPTEGQAEELAEPTNGVRLLEWGESPRQVLTYELSAETDRTLKLSRTLVTYTRLSPRAAMKRQTTQKIEMAVGWKASDRIDDKRAKYLARVVDATSESDASISAVSDELLKHLESQEATMEVSSDGRALSAQDAKPFMHNLLQPFMAVFPDVPIGPGAVWEYETDQEPEPDLLPEGGGTDPVTTTAKLVSFGNRKAIVELERSGAAEAGGLSKRWHWSATVTVNLNDVMPAEAVVKASDYRSTPVMTVARKTYAIRLEG